MVRTSVSSSNIRSIGYDAKAQILEVEFKSGGIYQYLNVPEDVFDRFMAASSKGRFFDQRVKDRYRAVKMRS